MRAILLIGLLLPICLQAQDFGSIATFKALINQTPAQIDSLLTKKGFKQDDINGLTFSYKSVTETVNYTSFPKAIEYITPDKQKYFALNSDNVKNGSVFVQNDTLKFKDIKFTAARFQLTNYQLSYGTFISPQTKKTLYFFAIQLEEPAPKKVESSVVNNAEIKADSTAKADGANDYLNKMRKVAQTQRLHISKNANINADSIGGRTFAVKRYQVVGAVGLFRTNNVAFSIDQETLLAYNLGLEISNSKNMKARGRFLTNTKTSINATSFFDMQTSYPNGLTENISQTMFLSKHFITAGYLPELRFKDESLSALIAAGMNLTYGRMSGFEDNSAFFTTLAMRTGIYYKHSFRSKSKNKDIFFARAGFEQFFSQKGGYIGQFLIGVGY